MNNNYSWQRKREKYLKNQKEFQKLENNNLFIQQQLETLPDNCSIIMKAINNCSTTKNISGEDKYIIKKLWESLPEEYKNEEEILFISSKGKTPSTICFNGKELYNEILKEERKAKLEKLSKVK